MSALRDGVRVDKVAALHRMLDSSSATNLRGPISKVSRGVELGASQALPLSISIATFSVLIRRWSRSDSS